LTYVGMTRHRDQVTLYVGRDAFKDVAALSSRLSRTGLKETTLDYAQRRGIERDAGAPPAPGLGAAREAPAQKRSMFDGLKLNVPRPSPEIGRVEGSQAPKQERPSLDRLATDLEQAAERYARAWEDQQRMRDQSLPTLEYQKRELKEAAASLESVRPGAVNDLHNAMRYEPQTWRAMKQLRGPDRAAELAGAIRHEDRVKRDPALQAERLVKDWQSLEKRHDKLRDNYLDRDARQKIEKQMQGIAGKLKRDSQLESLVRVRAKALGMDMDTRLGRVLQVPSIGAAMSAIARGRGRGLGL
jgi:hypothetical protein